MGYAGTGPAPAWSFAATSLGLIGFVFLGVVERGIGVSLCLAGGCGDSWVFGIGFVLRKKGRFVEGARQL